MTFEDDSRRLWLQTLEDDSRPLNMALDQTFEEDPRHLKMTSDIWRWKYHTLYLSFLLHRQDFRKPNFTPKKTTKITKNTKNVSEKVIYMHFFHSFWKNLHLTENFYTDMSVVSVTNMRCVCPSSKVPKEATLNKSTLFTRTLLVPASWRVR